MAQHNLKLAFSYDGSSTVPTVNEHARANGPGHSTAHDGLYHLRFVHYRITKLTNTCRMSVGLCAQPISRIQVLHATKYRTILDMAVRTSAAFYVWLGHCSPAVCSQDGPQTHIRSSVSHPACRISVSFNQHWLTLRTLETGSGRRKRTRGIVAKTMRYGEDHAIRRGCGSSRLYSLGTNVSGVPTSTCMDQMDEQPNTALYHSCLRS